MIFGKEIRALSKRLTRAKVFGQELELSDSLEKLDQSALVAAATAEAIPSPPQPLELGFLVTGEDDEDVRMILEQAESSPKLALISLAVEIEKELREIIFSQGEADKPYVFTIPNAIRILERRGLVNAETIEALRQFQKVRNQIVHHGRVDVTSDDIFRAIDSGLVILKTLKSISRQVNTVYRPNVEVFADKEGTEVIPNVSGLILDMQVEGHDARRGIYPTTRTHYKKGMKVAWEWNTGKRWGQAWYRDPDSGEFKYAWGGALEFVGRDLGDT